MNTTTTAVGAIRRLERPECTAQALREFHWVGELLATLDGADWSRPTDCPVWDVRAVADHILGMAQTFSSLRQFLPYMSTAARTRQGRDLTDSLTALQLKRTAGLDRSTLITDIGMVGVLPAKAWRALGRVLIDIQPCGGRFGSLMEVNDNPTVIARTKQRQRTSRHRATVRSLSP